MLRPNPAAQAWEGPRTRRLAAGAPGPRGGPREPADAVRQHGAGLGEAAPRTVRVGAVVTNHVRAGVRDLLAERVDEVEAVHHQHRPARPRIGRRLDPHAAAVQELHGPHRQHHARGVAGQALETCALRGGEPLRRLDREPALSERSRVEGARVAPARKRSRVSGRRRPARSRRSRKRRRKRSSSSAASGQITGWKRPSRVKTPSVTITWRCGWKLAPKLPKVWSAMTAPARPSGSHAASPTRPAASPTPPGPSGRGAGAPARSGPEAPWAR